MDGELRTDEILIVIELEIRDLKDDFSFLKLN